MPLHRSSGFRPIGEILARQVLPGLCSALRYPLRVSRLGTVSFVDDHDTSQFDRTIVLGECTTPEDAMTIAAQRVSRDDIRVGEDDTLRFEARIAAIHDSTYGLVLAGEIRARLISWQQPVSSDAQARHIVREAGHLRGMAFAACERSDDRLARNLRYRASLLETRLVDRGWRETAAELLSLPRAA